MLVFRGHIWHFFLLFSLLLASIDSFSQSGVSNDILARQRAIFIYNFTQQIGWDNFDNLSEFNIGVLGDDSIFSQLSTILKTRTVRGKEISLNQFNSIEELVKVQLLYVNKKYNFNITDVLSRISGQNTLLVSEDYSYNESMVNMINVGGSFRFQLNERRLSQENFTVSPSLKEIAISTPDKWQELYLQAEQSLANERERVARQEKILKEQHDRLLKQQHRIDNQVDRLALGQEQISIQKKLIEMRNKEFDSLSIKSQQLIDEYKRKLQALSILEGQIVDQQDQLKDQKNKFENQRKILDTQEQRIESQKKILEQQESELNVQRRISYLLAAIILLALLVSFFIYRGYRIKQKSNYELAEKNRSIKEKTVQLEIQNREMEQFAYVASHDLQEPLHTIASFIDLLSNEYKEVFDENGKKSLDFIAKASIRMRRLIVELLAYSKLGENVAFSTVDCNAVLQDIMTDFKSVINQNDAKIVVEDLPNIHGYATGIRLLFQNLISNAIKFQDKNRNPVIRIGARRVEDTMMKNEYFYEFFVVDNGIGIPDKYQSKIFTIFQRLHSRQEYEGTGIGLAHCRKIVELHKGTIWLTSAPDQGSTFFFKIPEL